MLYKVSKKIGPSTETLPTGTLEVLEDFLWGKSTHRNCKGIHF